MHYKPEKMKLKSEFTYETIFMFLAQESCAKYFSLFLMYFHCGLSKV